MESDKEDVVFLDRASRATRGKRFCWRIDGNRVYRTWFPTKVGTERYTYNAQGISDNIGNHDDIATCVEYSYETGQVISGGWDKRIKCWDARSMKPLTCGNTVSVVVESLSVNGFIAMVAVGLSVNMYDLRKFNDSFYSKSVDIQIKWVRPYVDQGFAAGSVDGRVALKYFKPSEQNNDGYI